MNKAIKKIIQLCLYITPFVVFSQKIDLGSNWKFKTGDNIQWAIPGFDDSSWKNIQTGKIWELTGYDNYDGYAWYRTKFTIPKSILKNAFLKENVKIELGKIDDCDQVFLNGVMIGQNAGIISPLFELADSWNVERTYIIPVNHPALLWDKENIIAIRVWDRGGGGGLYSGKQTVSMCDITDYIHFDKEHFEFGFKQENKIENKFKIDNTSPQFVFKGTLNIKVMNYYMPKSILTKNIDVIIEPNKSFNSTITFDHLEGTYVIYSLTSTNNKYFSLQQTLEVPFILTPSVGQTPRINGAKIFGVRPGSPFLFTIAATGERPLIFSTSNLPEGLHLDKNTGLITGKLSSEGDYIVKITAENKFGKTTRELKIVCGNKIALTPPMGWNSWNCWGLSVSKDRIIQSANAMKSSGLINHGWTYINIDDGWELVHKENKMTTNEKFPDMKGLTDYVHSLGLKMGIYSSPGPKTCGGYEGSFMYEFADAQTFDEWGIDYLKYDWCSYGRLFKNPTLEEMKEPYRVMQKALSLTKRDIVYSLCQYGMGDVWKWGNEVNGNLWRTTGDIEDTWESMSGIGFNQNKCAPYSKQGGWNDPDMLVVGKVGWGPSLHKTRLTVNEQYTHISLWALLSAPLLIGCDMEQLDEFTINLLSNDEVIDINQDPLAKPAVQLIKTDDYEIWTKELENGEIAVGLFNKSLLVKKISLNWSDLKINGKYTIRNVWKQMDMGYSDKNFETQVLPHGVVLVKILKN